MDVQEEESQQQVKGGFPVDAGCPEEGRREEEDGEGCERIAGKMVPEHPEQRDIPEKHRYGKKDRIDVEIIE